MITIFPLSLHFSKSLSLTSLISPSSTPPFQKRAGLYQSAMAYEVAVRLGTSFTTEADLGNPLEGKGPQSMQ